uniref:Uncharacterized protein n=1 Tax=Arundo donax TaxID=35708 RepID=A0A0A9DXK8_ARUDO
MVEASSILLEPSTRLIFWGARRRHPQGAVVHERILNEEIRGWVGAGAGEEGIHGNASAE